MPQRNNREAPSVMTWPKASPIIIAAWIVDLARLFFQMFWFFGPALAALYCTSKVSDVLGSLGGATAVVCSAGAVAAGVAAAGAIALFGVVLSMACGLLGFIGLGSGLSRKIRKSFVQTRVVLYGSWVVL